MKNLYIPKGKTLHYETLYCQNIVNDGTLIVDGTLHARSISGKGILKAGTVSVRHVAEMDIECATMNGETMAAERVCAAEIVLSGSATVSCYGAASPAAADHNPHVGHVPLFPDGCRRMERHWGRHADARRPLWRWKGRLYSGIPHGSHDDLLCQDWRRVECGGTDPRSGRTGQADQHL